MRNKDYFDQTINFMKEKAVQFGSKGELIDDIGSVDDGFFKLKDNSLSREARQRFISIISAEEPNSGPFHDFTITIFTSLDEKYPHLVCFGIGSLGFKNDHNIARLPGIRRRISKFLDEKSFCKQDFSDVDSRISKDFLAREDLNSVREALNGYAQVIPACQIVEDLNSQEGKEVIAAFLAYYAEIRYWGTNKAARDKINVAQSNRLTSIGEKIYIDEEKEIENLLFSRKYVVIQGPPGTGKTRAAKKISEKIKARTFFTQLHAETSYSDLIYGIRPSTDVSEGLNYVNHKGEFYKALRFSIENQDTPTVLIIDEINRANLSNVLGEMFYLFEKDMDITSAKIKVGDLEISALPPKFFVIATMNSADRSLAVVDFALRRRFAWYHLKPKAIESNVNGKLFFNEDFTRIEKIFFDFASNDELEYQPGQSYFIAESDAEMNNRLKYELLPLIKEYLQEGLLLDARQSFALFFKDRIGIDIFE